MVINSKISVCIDAEMGIKNEKLQEDKKRSMCDSKKKKENTGFLSGVNNANCFKLLRLKQQTTTTKDSALIV